MLERTISIGALLAALAVGLGAFGAHGLKETLSPQNLETFRTGAQYQLAHGAALVLVGALARSSPSKTLAASAWLFLIGIVCFSGSLYALALSGVRAWGAVAPIGGAGFISGWIALAVATWPKRDAPVNA